MTLATAVQLTNLIPLALTVAALLAHVIAAARANRAQPPRGKTMPDDAPISTALPDPTAAAAAFANHPMTMAVVQAVQANPAVEPHNAATVAASVLDALMPLLQPALQVSRASERTSAEVAIAMAALRAILEVFHPHPALFANGAGS